MKAAVAFIAPATPFSVFSSACHSSTTCALPFLASPSSSSLSACRSTGSLPLLLRCRWRPTSAHRPRFVASSIVGMAAVAAEPVDVLVKAAVGDPEKIGDCPFSQRVLLTLEEKGIPYNAKYVDLTNKPDWFLEINPEGKVPVIKHEGKWVPDSDVITQIIEEKFPEPELLTPSEKGSAGSKIFPSFVKFLKSKDATDGSEEALVAELTTFNDYLKDNGPFINGEKISAADLSLAPKLFHLQVALGHYKKWSIPSNLTYLNSYIEVLHARESFVKTKPAEEHVVAGWQKHVS
eukprot:c21701_g1_i1 orf=95-970(+)